MENRRSTRIPRPGAALKAAAQPLAPLSENQVLPAVPSVLGKRYRPRRRLPAHPPAPAAHPPPPPQENTAPLPSAGLQRKRKVISPAGKSGPLAKRATVTSTAAAPSGRPPAVPVPAEDNIWEAVAEETGWTLTDCLSHKVAFAKRADAKAKVGSGGRGAAVG